MPSEKKLNESGFTAEKVGLLTGNPIDLGLPRYFAQLDRGRCNLGHHLDSRFID